MNPEIDPGKDRDEFIRRLEKIMKTPDHVQPYVEALMENNTTIQKKCVDEFCKQKAKIKHFLDLYDAAKTYEDKVKVVGSVTPMYEPTDLEIQTAKSINKRDLLRLSVSGNR